MSTRDKLLSAFAENPDATLSGAGLAKRLGITRTSVWKAVSELKTEGFPLQSLNRQGYRFESNFDLSLFGLAQSAVKGYRIHYEPVAMSTQTLAKQGALQNAPEGSLWVAERQTAGRGRLDRVWESAWGGLWFSLLMRPSMPAARVPPITMVAALSLRHAIQEVTGIDTRLKWPNDVLVKSADGSWKKLAGILTEMAGDMDRTQWVVIGIGVNVNNTVAPALKNVATSLHSITGKAWPRGALLKSFLKKFSEDSRLFQRSGFAAFEKPYWKAYSRPDELIRLRTSRGDIMGKARGVDASGAIIIESRRQRQHLSEGEIIL